MPNPSNVEVDLLAYGDLATWVPQVGDVIHKDGLLNRWVAVITEAKGTSLSIRKAGNPKLLVTDNFKEDKISVFDIKNAFVGSYYVVAQRGTYYV